jgi:hypothetical protein
LLLREPSGPTKGLIGLKVLRRPGIKETYYCQKMTSNSLKLSFPILNSATSQSQPIDKPRQFMIMMIHTDLPVYSVGTVFKNPLIKSYGHLSMAMIGK